MDQKSLIKTYAKMLAIENQGLDLSHFANLDEAWFSWWQGLSECGHSELDCERIMEAEVEFFIEDIEENEFGYYDAAMIMELNNKLRKLGISI